MDQTLIQILDEFTRCRTELLQLQEAHTLLHQENEEMLAAARSLDASNQALRIQVTELEQEKASWPRHSPRAHKSSTTP